MTTNNKKEKTFWELLRELLEKYLKSNVLKESLKELFVKKVIKALGLSGTKGFWIKVATKATKLAFKYLVEPWLGKLRAFVKNKGVDYARKEYPKKMAEAKTDEERRSIIVDASKRK